MQAYISDVIPKRDRMKQCTQFNTIQMIWILEKFFMALRQMYHDSLLKTWGIVRGSVILYYNFNAFNFISASQA